jgi:hypothetical protein
MLHSSLSFFFCFLLAGSNLDPPVIGRISFFKIVDEVLKLAMPFISVVIKPLVEFVSSPKVGAKCWALDFYPVKVINNQGNIVKLDFIFTLFFY